MSDNENTAAVQPAEDALRAILKEIFAADQSDPDRSKAFDCYHRLLELKGQFLGTAVEPEYHSALSLESFHMGQIESLDRRNPEVGRMHFASSLGHADDYIASIVKLYGHTHPSHWWWRNYVALTITYCDNNVEEFGRLAEILEGDAKVAERLRAGLERHGAPNYRRDYAGFED